MATIYYTDGATKEVLPANGTDFSLNEVRDIVGGYVEVVHLPDGRIILINEEGKLEGLSRNEQATQLADLPTSEERWKYKLALQEMGISIIDASMGEEEDYIAGNALVCRDEEFR